MTTVTRPALRYHGGKWRLAPWIISQMPPHRTYVEPFGGAASVLLRKPRVRNEIYNDLDGEIVSLFRVLRNPSQARELLRVLDLTPYAREEFECSYLPDGDPIEQARRTLVRSWQGFGARATTGQDTGFRHGSRAHGNASQEWARFPSALSVITERLRGVIFENIPALDLIAKYDSATTLFYCDPPYVWSERNTSTVKGNPVVYRYEMTDDEHRELAGALRSIAGMAIISGYACEMYDRELYPDWQRVECSTHADGGRDRIEALWISPSAVSQPSLF